MYNKNYQNRKETYDYVLTEWKTKIECKIIRITFLKTLLELFKEYKVNFKFVERTGGSDMVFDCGFVYRLSISEWEKVKHHFDDNLQSYIRDKKIHKVITGSIESINSIK